MEKNSGTKPVKLRVSEYLNDNEQLINDILESNKGHPNILAIKDIISALYLKSFKFQKTDVTKKNKS